MTAKYMQDKVGRLLLDRDGNCKVSIHLGDNINVNNLTRKCAFDVLIGGTPFNVTIPPSITAEQWKMAVNLQLIGLRHLNVAINN